MPPPELDTSTTTGHMPPCNMTMNEWTPDIVMQSKHIELQLINAHIEKDKIKFKIGEQKLRAKKVSPLSSTQ